VAAGDGTLIHFLAHQYVICRCYFYLSSLVAIN